jgi:hypothetical protein
MGGRSLDRERFTAEIRDLAPDVDRPAVLWAALAALAPQEDARSGELAAIREDLLRGGARGSPFAAWWQEFGVMPGRAIGVAAATTLGVLALYVAAPKVEVSGHPLAWAGLFGPWLGLLWSLALSPAGDGPWADWEAMAPAGPALRAASGLAIVAAVAAVVGGAMAVLSPHGEAWPALLTWAGPFSLGAVGALALAWRWGIGTAVAVSAAVWGVPAALGTGLAPGAWGVARWLLWYGLAPAGGRVPQADVVCLALAALAALAALWLAGTGPKWTSTSPR